VCGALQLKLLTITVTVQHDPDAEYGCVGYVTKDVGLGTRVVG